MVRREAIQVISEETMRKVKVEGADKSVANEVQHTFLEILKSFSFKQLDQQLDALRIKHQAGNLDENDLELFKKLRVVHTVRKTEIQDNVANVFKLSKEGKVRQASLLAKKLIKDGSEPIPDTVVSQDQRKELAVFASQAVKVVADQETGDLAYETHKDDLISAEAISENGARLVNKLDKTIDQEVIQKDFITIGQEVEKQDAEDVLTSIYNVKNSIENEAAPLDARLVKTPDKKELKRRLKMTALGEEVEPILSDLLDNGTRSIQSVVDRVARGEEVGRKELEKYIGELYKSKKFLDSERVAAGLTADHGRKMIKRKVKLEIGGYDLGTLRKGATKKERLDCVLKLVTGEQPWTDVEKVDLLVDALNIPVAERPRAEAILGAAQAWESKYGIFAEKVEGLKSGIENVLHPAPSQEEERMYRQYIASGGNSKSFRELGVLRPGVIMSGVNDQDTVLTEYGKEVQKQMTEFELKVYVGKDRDGHDKFRAETNAEYWDRRKNEGSVPSNHGGMGGRSIELQKITGGKKFRELDPAEANKIVGKVKEGIEDMVGRIMATQDSSRAPNNQPLSWEINELMSWLDTKEDADFRDLWQARLGTYDQSAVLGSVGKKDAHEQIAGYVPREWLAILFEDEINFGSYRDLSGEIKQYNLTSKHVHTMLSEQVPGENIDRTDIWMGRILGAQSLEESGLMKRRFMAFLLGEQRGVEFAFDANNNFNIVNNPENIKRAKSLIDGKEMNIFTEVGLSKDGSWMDPKKVPPEIYEEFEKYDLFATKWFFLNQSLTRHRIELTENELERGGNENGWWAQSVNAFRKLHGRSARDYTEEKYMGMTSSRAAMDSYWRSFPAWKMMSKDKDGDYFVIHKLMKGLEEALPGITKEQKDDFVAMFEHIAYMPERFEIGSLLGKPDTIKHGYGGGLRATADVRHMEEGEWDSIVNSVFSIGKSNTFNWKPILEIMMPEKAMAGGLPANLKGLSGLEMFKKNYDVNQFIDYGSLMQGFWVDFLSYTGAQAKIWDNMSELSTNLANPQLQTTVIKQIRGFDDGLANAKATEWLAKITNETGMDLTGYDTLVNKDGEETSKKWRIIDNGDRKELDYVKELGYTRLNNGHVIDKNGHYVARPGKISFFNNFNDLNAKKSLGSPWIGRDFVAVSWEDKRDLVYGYLRTFNISDPKIWRDAHARFNASMYFGAELDAHEAPTMKNVIKHLNRYPWKYVLLPYTILRGIYTDAPISWGMIIEGWGPFGKQLGRIFGQ